jgi:hypothetical protein
MCRSSERCDSAHPMPSMDHPEPVPVICIAIRETMPAFASGSCASNASQRSWLPRPIVASISDTRWNLYASRSRFTTKMASNAMAGSLKSKSLGRTMEKVGGRYAT